jgi:hypothetical protein
MQMSADNSTVEIKLIQPERVKGPFSKAVTAGSAASFDFFFALSPYLNQDDLAKPSQTTVPPLQKK